MGAISPVLGCDESVLGCDEPVLGCDEIGASGAMGSLLFLSLLFSWGGNPLKVK